MAKPGANEEGDSGEPETAEEAPSLAVWVDRQPANERPYPVGQEEADLTSAPPPLTRILEALLFVGGAPLTLTRAAEAIRGLTAAQFLQAIETLNRDYRAQCRPYRLRPREQGFELALQPNFRSVQERLYGSTRETRLSPVALDVLALVAYRQPATKAEIDTIRGADSTAALRQLVRVSLVTVQRGQSGQQEVSYSTTRRLLSLFDLTSLEDLPRTQDPERM